MKEVVDYTDPDKILAEIKALGGTDAEPKWATDYRDELLALYGRELEDKRCGSLVVYLEDFNVEDGLAGHLDLYLTPKSGLYDPELFDELHESFFDIPDSSDEYGNVLWLVVSRVLQMVHLDLRKQKHPLGDASMATEVSGDPTALLLVKEQRSAHA